MANRPPEDVKLKGNIVAAADSNPDINGRPSPVVIAVYQLKSPDGFLNGDFFSVYDPKGAALGEDLLGPLGRILGNVR